MSAVDYMALELERRAKPFAAALLDAAIGGNVAAAALYLERVHGKVTDRLETTTTAEGLGLEELRALRDRLLAEHPELGSIRLAG